jgi:hypothetical protein
MICFELWGFPLGFVSFRFVLFEPFFLAQPLRADQAMRKGVPCGRISEKALRSTPPRERWGSSFLDFFFFFFLKKA